MSVEGKVLEEQFFLGPEVVQIVSNVFFGPFGEDGSDLPMDVHLLRGAEPPRPETRLLLVFVGDRGVDHVVKSRTLAEEGIISRVFYYSPTLRAV